MSTIKAHEAPKGGYSIRTVDSPQCAQMQTLDET
jgi:hypothetical protein